MTSPFFGVKNGIINYKIESIGCHGLGVKLSAGVFSVIGANGLDLSNLNPGFVTLPQRSNPGLLNTYLLNANQSFMDSSSGSSTISGNLFGTTSGDIWSVDVPFYLYVCIDDSNSFPVFGISRIPNLIQSPSSANIGTPSSSTAGVSYGMFLFNDVTISNYDLNPVVCLGAFRMQKISGNDWTVQSLLNQDGIGRFLENEVFIYPSGVNGNASGAYFDNNGGTAPIFNDNQVCYKLNKDGMLWESALCANFSSPSSGGSGSVSLQHMNVLETDSASFGNNLHSGYGGFQNTPGNPFFSVGPLVTGLFTSFRLNNGTTGFLQNNSFNGTAGYSIEWCTHVPVRTT